MKTSLLIISSLALGLNLASAQGPLAPPTTTDTPAGPAAPLVGGAPQVAMKTLHQVEPRIDLNGPLIPGVLSTGTDDELIISAPGSYYLSKNLEVSKTTGIRTTVAGVTIDLMGFEIHGSATELSYGIFIGVPTSCVVKNGRIRGLGYGTYSNNAPSGGVYENLAISDSVFYGIWGGDANRLVGCEIINCPNGGIVVGPSSILVDCAVSGSVNSGNAVGFNISRGSTATRCTAKDLTAGFLCVGISAGDNCIIDSCIAQNNTAAFCKGISAGVGTIVRNCVGNYNHSIYSGSFGIEIGAHGQAIQCAANSNISTAGTLSGSTGGGILLGNYATATQCTASNNTGDGIQLNGTGAIAKGNTCSFNGNPTGDAAGVHAVLPTCVIENNTVISNDRGIEASSFGALIIQNRSAANGTSFVIAINNKVAPISLAPFSPAISGTSGGAGVGTTDPWANIAY